MKTTRRTSIFFSPKDSATTSFGNCKVTLHYAQNIAALKCDPAEKPLMYGYHGTPLMQFIVLKKAAMGLLILLHVFILFTASSMHFTKFITLSHFFHLSLWKSHSKFSSRHSIIQKVPFFSIIHARVHTLTFKISKEQQCCNEWVLS